MDLRQQMAELKSAMQAIVDRAKAESRDLTDDEANEIEQKAGEFEQLRERAERAEKASSLVARITSVNEPEPPTDGPDSNRKNRAGGNVASRFVNSDAFKSFRESHPSGVGSGTPVRIEAKGVGSVRDLGIGAKAEGAEMTTETGVITPAREPGYRNALPVDEPLTFLDLVNVGTTDVAYSEYAQVIAETDNAAVVPEGELKPTSDLETADQESKAYTYADGFVVTNQQLADDGALVAFMEGRIRRHVRGVIEQKLFNGTGNGTEPLGIMNTTGTLAQAFSEDAVVTLGRALETFQTANGTEVSPQAIVMHPTDIWNLRFLKDDQGRYLLGNPLQQGPIPTPWGVPVVPSGKLTVGTALVGRFDSVQYLELEPLNVLAFNQHKDFAQRNKVYVRAESRGRQLFYMPREVVVATIAAPAE